MRTFILILALLFSPSSVNPNPVENKSITVMQINAKWNKQNNINLKNLIGCKVQFAWLEDQPQSLKKEIQTVPIVVIYDGNKPVRQWSADLSFKLEVDLNEIQKTINSIR
jgi:hypothetical protein